MRSTRIVTSFIKDNDKFLILKRSNKVKTMKGLWAGISGIIENNEEPLNRAKIEIFEELGITEDKIKFLKSASKMKVHSPQYENHEWEIFPFLFESNNPTIKLNWENSEYKWITVDEMKNYETVPSIDKVLLSLL
ncbi:MAG: NUDIX domain-containing protein [Nitrosopumilaceae archaeon]|uniref:NUDIX domain-containing protein n=1 Tax=Candidatus Nitrosomaritimum aestuariumsis TaxID=3342354 RepID=A0AC60W1X8_9ARCH|nr:NUDIX domain-containing protein [Nitrosopumilaceae archaeon]